MFVQFDKDKPGMVMLSPTLEREARDWPEVKQSFKMPLDVAYNYSAGHLQEGFWLCHESSDNQVKIYYPFKAPATYKLPAAWKGKALVLIVTCWNQSSVILEQVCEGFNLSIDKIFHEDRELNIADYNSCRGQRLSDLPDSARLF